MMRQRRSKGQRERERERERGGGGHLAFHDTGLINVLEIIHLLSIAAGEVTELRSAPTHVVGISTQSTWHVTLAVPVRFPLPWSYQI